MENKEFARAKYEAALTAFAQPGGRWQNKGALTYWGKAAGLSADEIIEDAHAHGVTNRDGDIRRGWNDARILDPADPSRRRPRATRTVQRPATSHYVRELSGGMRGEPGTVDGVRELSPCRDWMGKPPQAQTAMFLRAAFRPDEKLHIFRDDRPTAGVPWVNLRAAADWLERLPFEPLPGDHIVPNPFTGSLGETTDGKKSLIAQSCLAAFPFMLIEFDEMPLAMQYAFWRAFLLKSELAKQLVALVYTGGKSVHGLLHVGCNTLLDWQAVRNPMCALIASDELPLYRADAQAMRPRTGTRLPGVERIGKGTLQELVYLNPAARPGNMWQMGV